jgi:hypothetical protein
MKILETIERECCAEQDLKPYMGMLKNSTINPIFYCQHCGELWIPQRKMRFDDGPELRYERLFSGQPADTIFDFLFHQGKKVGDAVDSL